LYCVQQFVFVTVVANRPFGRLGVERRILLCTAVCVCNSCG